MQTYICIMITLKKLILGTLKMQSKALAHVTKNRRISAQKA